MENPSKMDDLGGTLFFWKHPYIQCVCFFHLLNQAYIYSSTLKESSTQGAAGDKQIRLYYVWSLGFFLTEIAEHHIRHPVHFQVASLCPTMV